MRVGLPSLLCLLANGCSFAIDLDGPPEVLCAPVEWCNGVDDDCDTLIDEESDAPCYDGPEGTEGVGPCRAGIMRCVAAPGSQVEAFGKCEGQVKPETEQCNAVDDDCDGEIDLSNGTPAMQACYPFDDGVPDVGRCLAGWSACVDGEFGLCQDAIGPRDETTNDVDDDCDGVVDE